MGAAAKVILQPKVAGGFVPLARNIVWRLATTVTVGTTEHLEGIILASTSVSFMTHSSLNGRILALTQINLDQATITQPPALA